MDLHFHSGAGTPDPFAVMINLQGREVLQQRYDYVAELLEECFEEHYDKLFASSRLHYEVINLIGLCTATFSSYQFPRREGNSALKKAITAIIHDYFKQYGRNA